jgi:hypothetical protein
LLDRFGREHKELLICQLFHIKQSSSVTEYVDKFAELVDQLNAYGHVTEPIYYAMKFVDGLWDDIRAAVSLHRPIDFDSAASLALLQEDVVVGIKAAKRADSFYVSKEVPKRPHPLPPPPRIDKQVQPILQDEKKFCEGKSPEDRLAALHAFRKAKGICIRCAEKWHREHKCATFVQLHVVQELLDLFSIDDMEKLFATAEDSEQLFLALSKEATSGCEGPRTMRLQESIMGVPVMLLVDSGSSHTFINQSLLPYLNHLQTQTIDVQVQVASGEVLHCDRILKHVPWAVNDCTFTTDMKVLPLGHFDFILGMDWLEVFSPMKVHWKHKWLALPYQGATAILQGITLAIPEEIIVHICSIVDPTPLPADSVRPEVAVILEEFAMVFQPLSQLPPERACDHVIPLIPGAKPVHIRPYKYPPSLKDEIEKQVADMLHKGIIQPSTSAFSSPILLVRKKDGS